MAATGTTRVENRRPRYARAAFWTLILTVAGVPLALLPGIQYFDITPKFLLVMAGACLAALFLALDGSAYSAWRAAIVKRATGIRDDGWSGGWDESREPLAWASPRWFAVALAVMAPLVVFSTAFSTNRMLSLLGSEWRRMGLPAWLACLVLAFVALVACRDLRESRRIAVAIALSATVAACYGLAQYRGFDPWINASLYHIGEGEWGTVRPPSTLGYVSYFANFATIGGFLALALGLSAARRAVQIAWFAAAFVIGLAVFASGARAAFVGVLAGLVVLAIFQERRKLFLGGVLVCALAAAALVASPLGQPVRSRMRWFLEDPGGGHRLLIWRDSVRLIGAHPLFGAGPDAYGLEFPRFESLVLAQALPDRYVESPHDVLLDYATNGGVPVLVCFLALLVVAVAAALRRISTRGSGRGERAFDQGALAALTAGIVASLFVADTIATRLVLLVTAAILAGRASEGWQEERAGEYDPLKPLTVRAGIIAVAALVLVLTVFAGQRMLRADRATALAARAATDGQYDALLADVRTASTALRWAPSYAFAGSRLLGEALLNARTPPAVRPALLQAAEESAQSAAGASDQPHLIYVHLASLYVLEGRTREAEHMLEHAIAAAPSWYRPHWLLAALLSAEGRRIEAAGQAEAALERGARSHPDIAAQCRAISQPSGKRQ